MMTLTTSQSESAEGLPLVTMSDDSVCSTATIRQRRSTLASSHAPTRALSVSVRLSWAMTPKALPADTIASRASVGSSLPLS